MSRMELRLLGAFQATVDGTSIPFRSIKARALLAYLAVESERPHRRESLTALLWPETPERIANNNFRQTLSSLRKAIGDRGVSENPVLLVTRETVQFNTDCECWLDVHAFQAVTEKTPCNLQAEAIQHYRGDFLEGFMVRDSPAFEDWTLLIRDRLQRQAAIMLQRLITAYAAQDDFQQASIYAWRWVELEPWQEDAHQQLMVILTMNGQRTAALAQFDICCEILAEEFGVEPSASTVQCYEQIRDGILTPTTPVAQQFQMHEPHPTHESGTPAFVARKAELDRMEMILRNAISGSGQVIFVTGEAGQGKTMLLQAFAQRVRAWCPQLIILSGSCQAYTGTGDPYLPFREIMAALAGQATSPVHTGRSLLPEFTQALLADGPDLINIFVPAANLRKYITAQTRSYAWVKDLEALIEHKSTAPEQDRAYQEDLFKQYTSVMQAIARHTPLLLLIDDMQWTDLGSINLLFHLARNLGHSRILIVGTYRPEDVALRRGETRHPLVPLVSEFKRLWGDIEIALNQADGMAFVKELLDNTVHGIDEDFAHTLFQQTRGNALFTVELLRGMQQRGDLICNTDGQWMQSPTLNWGILPARVEAVIGERIERLPGSLKHLLRVACVQGDSFTAEVVALVQDERLKETIKSLSNILTVDQHLVRPQGMERVAQQRLSRYQFQHILYQTYLYNSLDVVERARIHEAVAGAMLDLYNDTAQDIAPQLAWHFEMAGMINEAVNYYRIAGERAARMSANVEAYDHLRQGLTLLDTLPQSPDRDERELALQLAITIPLTSLKSWSAPETIRACDRALALSQTLTNTQQLLQSLLLQQFAHSTQAEHRAALAVAEQRYSLIQRLDNPMESTVGNAGLTITTMFVGQFTRSVQHLEQTLALYDPDVFRPLLAVIGLDPSIGAICPALYSLWYLGYPDRALKLSQQGLALAEDLDHAFALYFILAFKSRLHRWRNEIDEVSRIAQRQSALAQTYRIELAEAAALLARGWVLSEQGQPDEGITLFNQGLQIWHATGMRNHQTEWLSVLANMHAKAGRPAEGLALIKQAFAFMQQSNERYHEAELYRLSGLLRLQENPNNSEGAEAEFQRAITAARNMSATMCELRATVSLCRLWMQQDKREQAQEHLTRVYAKFTEGFKTHDLQDARALLDELKE